MSAPNIGTVFEEPDGTMILVVARGICPPPRPITHTCDTGAGWALLRWYDRDALLDADGNCRFCGERV